MTKYNILPKNINLYECRDDGSFGEMIGRYFAQGNGSIYILLHGNCWYFFNEEGGEDHKWHKPGPIGAKFCEAAMIDGKLRRVSEEQFEDQTGTWFLHSARDILGMRNPWAALLEEAE